MEAYKEEGQSEKYYRITLLRFGKVIIAAASGNEAAQKALHLDDTEIHWLSERDGIPGGRLVSLVELLDEIQ